MIRCDIYGEVKVVVNDNHKYGVLDKSDNVIVPFGKYGWISGFDHGLARVKSFCGKQRVDLLTGITEYPKWGIIDESGNEVLPVEYDEIWNFFEKNRDDTLVYQNGTRKRFLLSSRVLLSTYHDRVHSFEEMGHSYQEKEHFGEYAGTYAQDEMGYSDEFINDVLCGEPDAYWNID